MPLKVLSGGQTGVDRAALDAALELGLECGGWCPQGRLAEDGPIPARYPMSETPTAVYAVRTEWNVRDADATLVLSWGEPTGGTALTIELARAHKKPCLVVDLLGTPSAPAARAWLSEKVVAVLNVAGPRGSRDPGVYPRAKAFLTAVLSAS